MFEFDKCGVSFKDDDGDAFSLSMAFGNFLKWAPNDDTGTAFLTSDMCRGIGRIMLFFAEKGCMPTSEEDLMAWVCGDAAEETTTPTTPSTDGTLAAIQDRLDEVEERLTKADVSLDLADLRSDLETRVSGIIDRLKDVEGWQRNRNTALDAIRIARRLDEVEERLASVEKQLAAASTPPQPVEKTPQQLADEMSERFPVGTRVDFWLENRPHERFCGIIYRKFYTGCDDCPVVAVVGAVTPEIYTAVKVEPATWTPMD